MEVKNDREKMQKPVFEIIAPGVTYRSKDETVTGLNSIKTKLKT